MGGMSWGGVSVGSWLQDDIMMTGTSPFNHNANQSPSFHSSSYLPRLEANFWSNLRCCETGFNDLHELLQHYEDVHQGAPSTFPHRMSHPNSGRFRRKSSFMNNGQGPPPSNQVRGFNVDADGHNSRPSQYYQDGLRPFNTPNLSAVPDMDTIGEMEMDYDQEPQAFPGHSAPYAHQQQQQRPPPINSGLANVMNANPSNPPTPTTAGRNPIISSMNTPSFAPTPTSHHQHQHQHRHSGIPDGLRYSNPQQDANLHSTANTMFNPHLLSSLNSDMNNLDFSTLNHGHGHGNGNGSDMIDLCINDPARALFSDAGRIDPSQAMHFGFVNGAATNPDDPNGAMSSPHLAAARAMLPGEEDRPFKCKVIGCEKAYKNANGLRYHEKHGHSGQQLRKNGDGSLSIVDPETNTPYPGTVGMEKEKPYRCDVCGKRYKNLNGLKYHRNHSAPCNPELVGFGNVALPGMGGVGQAVGGGEAIF